MAILFCRAQVIKRSEGRSAVACAAYRGGLEIEDERTGQIHDYTRKQGVLAQGILAPDHAPEWARDPRQLWNRVEAAEGRKDAQLSRELVIALPHEIEGENREYLIKNCLRPSVRQGAIAFYALHAPGADGDDRNTHAHVMLTMRPLTKEGEFSAKKAREWNEKQALEEIKKTIEKETNRMLERLGLEQRVSVELEEGQKATRHMGRRATYLERKGITTERGERNREIQAENRRQKQARELAELARQIAEEELEAQREAARQAEAERQEQARRREAEERRKAAEIEAQQRAEAKRHEQERRAEADRQKQAEKERLRVAARQQKEERRQAAEIEARQKAEAKRHEQERRAEAERQRQQEKAQAPEQPGAFKRLLDRWTTPKTPAAQAFEKAKAPEQAPPRPAPTPATEGQRFTLPTGERVTGYGFTQTAPQAPGNENRPESRTPEPQPREARPEQAPQAPPRPDPAQERAEAWERLQRRFQSARTPAARGFEKAQQPEQPPQPEPPRRNTEQREDFNKLRVPSRTERPASIGETHTPTADLWKADRLARAQREEEARQEAERQRQSEAQQREQEARRQKDEGERERTHAPANGNKPKSRAEEYREKMRQAYEEARNRGRTRERD